MTFDTTLIQGWPDAIWCGINTAPGGGVFLLHGAVTNGGAHYVQVFPNEYRYVTFNGDGTYKSKAGHDGSSIGCLGQSISQLYGAGRAFNLVTSKVVDSSGVSTMVQGWPDAIRCGINTAPGGGVFLLHGAVTNGDAHYVQVFPNEEYRYVTFNGDGTYKSKAGYDGSSIGCLGQSISQLYGAGRAFNLVTSKIADATPPTNTPPTCNSFSFTLNSGSSNTLNFASYVSDAQDPATNLKIKLNTLPTCGSITSVNGSAATSGQSYSISELIYKACSTNTAAIQDTISYSVVDTDSLESSKCNIGVSINAVTPTPTHTPPTNTTNNYCLKLKTLSLGSVGDLDRKNEEIELEITSLNKQLDCGIFIFDIVKNVKDKNININIPCSKGGFVDIRFIERDICNDDMTLKKLECEVTGRSVQLTIQITPDNTATSYTQCISSTKETQVCGDIKVGIVGGSFCYAYQWGKEECGTTQVSETTSEYILVYEVVDQGCDFGATNLQSNEHCYSEHYYPGPTCNANAGSTNATSDATTLDYSIALIAFSTLTLFFD
jgi:hypothetical protein